MQGLPDPPSHRGIIPRAFEHVFESVQVGASPGERAGPGPQVARREFLTCAMDCGTRSEPSLDLAQVSGSRR